MRTLSLKCGKKGHFQKECKAKAKTLINTLTSDQTSKQEIFKLLDLDHPSSESSDQEKHQLFIYIYIYIYEDILVIIKLYITGFRVRSRIFLIKPGSDLNPLRVFFKNSYPTLFLIGLGKTRPIRVEPSQIP